MVTKLRRKRRILSLANVAGLVSKGVASINKTVEPIARHWDTHNLRSLAQDGPLWVAFGDSVTQGIGASHPHKSYAGLVLERLRAQTGEPWRLINLSMTGGRFGDVVEHQLPAMHDAGLQPDVVSAIIGSNDVIWRRDTDAIIDDARAMVDALPHEAVLSRVSEARADRRRTGVNDVFDSAAASGDVRLFEAWDWPTGHGMWAEDRFHPNDRAYECLADNLWDALLDHDIV